MGLLRCAPRPTAPYQDQDVMHRFWRRYLLRIWLFWAVVGVVYAVVDWIG